MQLFNYLLTELLFNTEVKFFISKTEPHVINISFLSSEITINR